MSTISEARAEVHQEMQQLVSLAERRSLLTLLRDVESDAVGRGSGSWGVVLVRAVECALA